MNNRDIDKEISVVETLSPNIVTSTTSGSTVDLAGFQKAAFVAHIGTITDGTYAFDPEESDDGSSWSNIDSADLSGSFTNATSAADDTIQEVGYLGTKRYIRCNVTVTGSPSTGGPIGVTVIRAGARTLPQ